MGGNRNSIEAVKVSMALQDVAQTIDLQLEAIAGKRIGFSLFVWTDGRCNYISQAGMGRREIKAAIQSVIDGWDQGMPDVAAHEVRG